MNGLSINETEFKSLPATQQRLLLFKNSQQSLKLICSYRLHQKVQYCWLSALTIGLFFIIKQIITKIW